MLNKSYDKLNDVAIPTSQVGSFIYKRYFDPDCTASIFLTVHKTVEALPKEGFNV